VSGPLVVGALSAGALTLVIPVGFLLIVLAVAWRLARRGG
jgi:hypothetical protein